MKNIFGFFNFVNCWIFEGEFGNLYVISTSKVVTLILGFEIYENLAGGSVEILQCLDLKIN